MKNSNKPAVKPSQCALWNFALRVYSQPDVERLSIELQSLYHANVNIILWCCWLEREDIKLSESWLDDVLITIDTVSQLTVSKLREARRQVKESGNFTDQQSKAIAKHILNAEMLTEKVLLYRLYNMTLKFKSLDEGGTKKPLGLEYYLDFLQIPDAETYARKILDACNKEYA